MVENFNKAQPKEKLFERFPDGKIPKYWRTGELANCLECHTSTVRNLCRRYEIPRYRYPGTADGDEPTKQTIVLREDIGSKLLDLQIGEELFKEYSW